MYYEAGFVVAISERVYYELKHLPVYLCSRQSGVLWLVESEMQPSHWLIQNTVVSLTIVYKYRVLIGCLFKPTALVTNHNRASSCSGSIGNAYDTPRVSPDGLRDRARVELKVFGQLAQLGSECFCRGYRHFLVVNFVRSIGTFCLYCLAWVLTCLVPYFVSRGCFYLKICTEPRQV